jgi:hypothetical protein
MLPLPIWEKKKVTLGTVPLANEISDGCAVLKKRPQYDNDPDPSTDSGTISISWLSG